VTEIAWRRVYRSIGRRSEARALRLTGPVCAAAISLLASACGLSFPIASLFPDTETTSSITPRIVSPLSPLSPELAAEDWRRAKGALAVALDPQGSGSSVSWDNPDTDMKGNFAPVGQPFVNTDEICRAFLATLVIKDTTRSLQGTACRPSGGEWTLKDVKPWRKPA
jgi:surface antigen